MSASSRKFQRTVETFVCLHCGQQVDGDGYTNHCPVCLWSRHVDIHPGDRAATCGGAMEPVAVEKRGESLKIIHRCKTCGFERKNRRSEHDNFDQLLKIMGGS